MTINVTVNDMNIPESLKTDPGVIAEAEKIIADVTAFAFLELPFKAADDVHEDVEAAMNRLIRLESETRFYTRNQPNTEKPNWRGFYSFDASAIWHLYYDPWMSR